MDIKEEKVDEVQSYLVSPGFVIGMLLHRKDDNWQWFLFYPRFHSAHAPTKKEAGEAMVRMMERLL